MFDTDLPNVFSFILQFDVNSAWNGARQSLCPFDHHDGPLAGQLLDAQIVDSRTIYSIQIDMMEGPSTSILLDQHKCRAAHLRWIDSQSTRKPFHEGGLARSQIAK